MLKQGRSPWSTPQLIELMAPTRETRRELLIEDARRGMAAKGRPPEEVRLAMDRFRYRLALEDIACHPCRRLALRNTKVGWDCERLGAPLCESCIAAEALRGGSQGGSE